MITAFEVHVARYDLFFT